MRLTKRQLLVFGPLSALVEFIGIIADSLYWHPSGHQTLSNVSLATWPAPLIFALTLTVGATTYGLFALALNRYYAGTFRLGVVSGLTLTIAGWVRYIFKDNLAATVHGLSILLVAIIYELIIWQMSRHLPGRAASSSRIFFWVIAASILVTSLDLSVGRIDIPLVELITFGLFQLWGLYISWLLSHSN